VSLVAANYHAGGYPAEDILIMSPWAKQAEALSSNLLQLALSGAVPYEHIPEVKTVHGMQGGQVNLLLNSRDESMVPQDVTASMASPQLLTCAT
jgi:superfamily I DNA and/or RNA helicase